MYIYIHANNSLPNFPIQTEASLDDLNLFFPVRNIIKKNVDTFNHACYTN